jgi:hypothetical protein
MNLRDAGKMKLVSAGKDSLGMAQRLDLVETNRTIWNKRVVFNPTLLDLLLLLLLLLF